MTDSDKTVFSSTGAPQQPQTSKRNPLLMIGAVGCALLLCAVLLIGAGSLYFLSDGDIASLMSGETGETVATEADTPTVEPTVAEATLTPETGIEADSEAEAEATETDVAELSAAETEEAAEPGEPEIGPITFALGASEDYEPISPAISFQESITEVHAIFEYSGMLPEYSWERVWYLDGEEILRSPAEGAPPEAWSGAEAGVFDYFINNGGAPLPPGEWALEIYVEGELLATDTFTIEAAEEEEEELVTEVEQEGGEHAADIEPTATLAATPSPSASSGGGTYKLVYTKWDGGQHNLYVADTNGNGEQFILGRAAGPSWSPDGGTIFFYGQEGIDRQTVNGVEYVFDGISNGIVAMPASPLPSSIDQVTLSQGIDWKQGTARWANVSPDGQMVAFDAKPGGSDYRIYFLGTADNQQFRFEILGEQADWSPDSQRIVYRSGREGKTGIWISNRDDSGHTLITSNGSDSFPAWSPDGGTIAFSRDEGGNIDIYTVNVDGTNLQRLTDAPGPDTLPTYTPSGDIIFRSARSGSWSIWKMSGSGAGQTEIILNAGVGPDWSFSRMDVLQ